jgi:hypothetical protein
VRPRIPHLTSLHIFKHLQEETEKGKITPTKKIAYAKKYQSVKSTRVEFTET